MISQKLKTFYQSLKNHNIKPYNEYHFSLPVILESSDNEYLQYPIKGVIRVCEQGVDLHISQLIFHYEKEDGSLGAPVVVENAVFKYLGRRAGEI